MDIVQRLYDSLQEGTCRDDLLDPEVFADTYRQLQLQYFRCISAHSVLRTLVRDLNLVHLKREAKSVLSD